MTSTIDTITEEKLKKAIAEAAAHLDQLEAALPFLVSLTSEQRRRAGKLKAGEDAAIEAVFTTVTKHPAPFGPLNIEPRALRELSTRRALLLPIEGLVLRLSATLADTMLYVGDAMRKKASSAYHVAAALAPHDQSLATDVQPAQQFYQSVGRAGARTRKAHTTTSTPAPAPSKA